MRSEEHILEDYLRYPYQIKDRRIVNAVKKILSRGEQLSAEAHASVVSRKKLVVVTGHPERLREIILMRASNPRKLYRRRLVLDRKKNRAKT